MTYGWTPSGQVVDRLVGVKCSDCEEWLYVAPGSPPVCYDCQHAGEDAEELGYDLGVCMTCETYGRLGATCPRRECEGTEYV